MGELCVPGQPKQQSKTSLSQTEPDAALVYCLSSIVQGPAFNAHHTEENASFTFTYSLVKYTSRLSNLIFSLCSLAKEIARGSHFKNVFCLKRC